jgi:hypothetical protein
MYPRVRRLWLGTAVALALAAPVSIAVSDASDGSAGPDDEAAFCAARLKVRVNEAGAKTACGCESEKNRTCRGRDGKDHTDWAYYCYAEISLEALARPDNADPLDNPLD